MLVGPPKIEAQWGTGLIPAADLMDWARRPGVPDALDGVVVKHVSGGTSTLGFQIVRPGQDALASYHAFDRECGPL